MTDDASPAGSDSVLPLNDGVGNVSIRECYELIMRLALDRGLPPADADDACLVTMLRLLDSSDGGRSLVTSTGEWLLQTAVEQCVVIRRLGSWRGPHLVPVGTDSAARLQ